jgi:hypothetical protein
MNNVNKIDILDERLNNLQVHIDILTKDILINPESDVEGKPMRQTVLNDFISKKEAILAEKNTLTNLL